MNINIDIKKKIEQIIFSPDFLEKEFIISNYTYSEIFAMANILIENYSSLDKKNDVVCLCSENKALIAAALIAGIISEIPFILPYGYSKQILKELYEQKKYKVAVIDKDYDLPKEVNILNLQTKIIKNKDIKFEYKSISTNQMLLYLFTGGSTSKPKIWTKTIENLFLEAFYLSKKYEISDKDKIISTVPPYHIYGLLFSVIVPFVSNSSVVSDIYTFPYEIFSKIQEISATVLISTPLQYKALNTQDIKFSNNLRLAFSSAGTLNKIDASNFYENTKIYITEIYGSTETGGIASRTQIKDHSKDAFIPFECIDFKIIDEEIYIRSKFISSEAKIDEESFFRLSDRARYYDNKNFLLLGRSDSIVKVGGKRVDLDYVKEKIKNNSKVKDCVVISVQVSSGRENEIIAIIEGNLSQCDILKYLADELESYAMPRNIIIADKIPKTVTGKYSREEIEKLAI